VWHAYIAERHPKRPLTMTEFAELLSVDVSLSDLGCFCVLTTVALVLFSGTKWLL
jgi:hypothetical protein